MQMIIGSGYVSRAVSCTFLSALVWAAPNSTSTAGRNIFQSHCIVCHGVDARGNTKLGKQLKAKNLRLPEVQKTNEKELKHIVTEGKGDMPDFANQLTDAQIDEVVKYLRQLPTLPKNRGARK